MFEIEKGVKLPERKTGGRKEKYPFAAMEVEDSFFVPGKTSMGSTVQTAMKRHNIKLYAARDTKNGVEGVRVWRLPDDPESNGNNGRGKGKAA